MLPWLMLKKPPPVCALELTIVQFIIMTLTSLVMMSKAPPLPWLLEFTRVLPSTNTRLGEVPQIRIAPAETVAIDKKMWQRVTVTSPAALLSRPPWFRAVEFERVQSVRSSLPQS
eukprot:5865514-Prymnesium_polylepis.1